MTAHNEISSRMKEHEARTSTTLIANVPAIIRVDGHRFSRYTKKFAKPYDERLHSAMVESAKHLMTFFQEASVAYTQSDEISLIFPNGITLFNGRVQKLTSIAAAITSSVFNKAINHNALAVFDARVFNVDNEQEICDYLLWRGSFDCVRNSKNNYCYTHLGNKAIDNGVTSNVYLNILLEAHGLDYYATPTWYQFGTTIYRELVEHIGYNPVLKKHVVASRQKLKCEEILMNHIDIRRIINT